MPSETVQVHWIGDQQFLLQDRHGFPIVMTQPGGVNGADLLPLSLIGCSAWDVLGILRKQRQQITGLQVVATSLREDEPPWRFRKIHVLYRFSGHHLNPEQVQRAIELSETKYCSIYVTLQDAVQIKSEYVIVESQQ